MSPNNPGAQGGKRPLSALKRSFCSLHGITGLPIHCDAEVLMPLHFCGCSGSGALAALLDYPPAADVAVG